MTNQEKHDLADMVRSGLTEQQILERTVAKRATVKRYIKALRAPATAEKEQKKREETIGK